MTETGASVPLSNVASVPLDNNTQNKIAQFNFARLALMTLVLFTTIFLRQEVLGVGAILQIYAVLGASFLFSLVSVSFWEQTLRVRLYIPSQLLYDLLLTSFLVNLTGVNDSIFLVLYLLNIVFASVVFQLHGALTVAALSGGVYAFIYYANVDVDNGNAFNNLAYSELLFLLAALLSGQFMDELKRQKAMLETQRASIARLELLNHRLLNSIPVGLVTVDESEYVHSINQTALSLLKLKHTPEMRIKYHELLPELKGIIQAWEKMTETQRLRFLFGHDESHKSRFSLNLVKLSQEQAQELRGMQNILVFQDVSKMLELERRLEFESRLAATGELAAGIAHEIRNPLASISGSIEMLSRNLVIENDQERKLFEIARREIGRLNNLITDFLEFAKPRDESSDDFPLLEAVMEVSEAVVSGGGAGTPSLKFDIDVPASLSLHANRERIKQVFFNLFLNAKEAAEKDEVTMRIRALDSGNGVIKIDVSDDGPGIRAELAKKVFDPFFTTKKNGTGLGLSTVARIVKAAKGDIALVAGSGGAHFQISLPGSSAMDLAGTAG
jgi:two-component system, NtrC family, sensor histidine kinase PilS